jgi:hypothetical protein
LKAASNAFYIKDIKMNIQKTMLTCTIAALGLVGCGTEEQDGGISSRSGETSTLSSAVVVDGPIIRASVFEDLNGNLKRDSFEPSALTDNDGYFNVNPVKRVVYCSDLTEFGASIATFQITTQIEFETYFPPINILEFLDNFITFDGENFPIIQIVKIDSGQPGSDLNKSSTTKITPTTTNYLHVPRDEFCLNISDSDADANIVITGGYDLYTGEPFEGTMSISAANRKAAEQSGNEFAITPFTTLSTNSSDELTAYLETLGIENANENLLDPLNADGTAKADGDFKAKNFAITYQMHKLVTVVDAWAKKIYTEIGDHADCPKDLNSLISKQFKNLDEKNYAGAWTSLLADLGALYNKADVAMPTAPTPAQIQKLVRDLMAVNRAIETAFGYNSITKEVDGTLTFANVKARVRGVEVVVLKIIRGMDYTSALAALNDSNYLQNLAGDTTGENKGSLNFTQLVEFEGDTSGLVSASITAAISSGASLGSLAGKSLQFSDDDTEVNSQVAIFFTGEENASRGDIHMCFQYDENELKDSSVKLDGNYISGNWEAVDVLNNTVVLNMDIFGGTSAVLKKIEAGKYRFDYAGKITKFNSDNDFEVTDAETTIPVSSDACKVLLAINAVP